MSASLLNTVHLSKERIGFPCSKSFLLDKIPFSKRPCDLWTQTGSHKNYLPSQVVGKHAGVPIHTKEKIPQLIAVLFITIVATHRITIHRISMIIHTCSFSSQNHTAIHSITVIIYKSTVKIHRILEFQGPVVQN